MESDVTAVLTSIHEALDDARTLCVLPFKMPVGRSADEPHAQAKIKRQAISPIDALQTLLPHSFGELLSETMVERLYRSMRLRSSVLSQHAHVRNIAQFNAVSSGS